MMSESNTDTAVVKIETHRFGELEVKESDVITMEEGILGFPEFHRYVLTSNPDHSPFMWLQCVDDPELAFVVVDPFLFFPGYQVLIKPDEIKPLGLKSISDATILTIVVIPLNPMDITTNLRGPLVINPENNNAKQIVLIDDRYHTKHFLLHDIPPELAAAPDEAVSEPQ